MTRKVDHRPPSDAHHEAVHFLSIAQGRRAAAKDPSVKN